MMATPIQQFQSSSSRRSYLSSNTLLVGEKSPYHQRCIPKDLKERISTAPTRTRNPTDYEICNQVAQEMMWNERVKKETNLHNKWEKNLSFLADYDQYGKQKEKKEISTVVPSVYSLSRERPLTASREYGHRVNSAAARQMQSLQQTQTQMGLRKNKDLFYYY